MARHWKENPPVGSEVPSCTAAHTSSSIHCSGQVASGARPTLQHTFALGAGSGLLTRTVDIAPKKQGTDLLRPATTEW